MLNKRDSIKPTDASTDKSYADQFGGEKGKKLKSSNFKKLLFSLQQEPMQHQGPLLEEAFEKWRGNIKQLDDVCVIGVRV
ncbi:MAG: hypothetical protein P8M05_04895 [Flavobacteriales bacterium]|nr:hypothetical protein [Flavobacteriales bacterium]